MVISLLQLNIEQFLLVTFDKKQQIDVRELNPPTETKLSKGIQFSCYLAGFGLSISLNLFINDFLGISLKRAYQFYINHFFSTQVKLPQTMNNC